MIQCDPCASSRALRLPLIAGELAFDFANSIADRGGSQHDDYMPEARDVIVWAHLAKLLGDGDRDQALATILRDDALASRLRTDAHRLRETVYAIGVALVNRETPCENDRAALATIHSHCLGRARLSPSVDGFAWNWDPGFDLVAAVLGPITLSALTLLTQQDLARVKRCEGDHCGWLIYDATKNRRRRWCEMEVCGNRAKMRAFRARKVEAK